jgi:pimeloyl-ACP methyl ester carboxylesterase
MPSPSAHVDHPAPGAFLLTMEMRAPWEFAALLPAWFALQRAPRGDGHPVIVFPGLSASDASTAPLRSYLRHLGYAPSGWNQGFNFGPRAGVLRTAREQLEEAVATTGRRASLIGWSLGGIYARELAKQMPDLVRSVVTLGTPFAGRHTSTNAWRLYALASGRDIESETTRFDLPQAPPMPTSSIFSRTDGVVAWKASVQQRCPRNPHTENIEVVASHVGLGLNPSTWWALADRLAQPEGAWRAFERKRGLHGILFPDPLR